MSAARLSPILKSYISDSGLGDEHDFDPENIRDLGDGTYVLIRRLMFHWSMVRGDFGDLIGYFDRWCYADKDLAKKALEDFPKNPPKNYEPSGWHRHPSTSRRRPEGDPLMEYIDP